MRHVPIAEFQDRASEYVDAAASGEEIVITRHGRDLAKLSPAAAPGREGDNRAAIEAMLATREALRVKGVSISVDELIDWKNEGRR